MIEFLRLHQLMDYDSSTGLFRAKTSRGCLGKGKSAKWHNGNGYIRIEIDGRRYHAHRLAWFYSFGEWPQYIDHINGDRADNRLQNLRNATQSQNAANMKRGKPKGISFDQRTKRWVAQITVNYKNHFLGRFETPEAAHATYCAAALKYFGEFARFR